MCCTSGSVPFSKQASCMQMQADGVSRRDILSGLTAAAVVAVPVLANADTEYPNIPFLGGSDQVDVNNANIRVYTRCVPQSPPPVIMCIMSRVCVQREF